MLSFIAYVLMCLLHDGMILIVFLRILLYSPSNRVTSKLKYLLVFWKTWIDVIANLLKMIPNPYFSSAADKLLLYSTEEAADMWSGGIGGEILAMVRILVLCAIAVYCVFAKEKDDYVKMLQLLMLFCFGGLSSAALIGRYTTITFLFAIPFILKINDSSNCNIESEGFLVQTKMLPMLVLILGFFACLVLFQYQYFI